jgi:superfamily II DNA/RNA helicase
MRKFKARQVQVLVGTDVLSRGIDVEGISLVLNFDVPPDPEDYIHRIGRTARAEESGLAVTFVNRKDLSRFRRIEQLLGHSLVVSPLPDHIGTAPDFNAVQHDGGGSSNNKKRPFHRKKGSNTGHKPRTSDGNRK